MLKKDKYENLLKHFYWGNFDTGVIFIFLSLFIWDKTENMITVAIAFSIPIIIDTLIDYFFSYLSDKKSRIKLIIIGNIGSSIFLSLYGFSISIYMLYGFIFLKSLFAKLYQSSLQPYIRENIEEHEYMEFIAKRNIKISVGASIGGFTLMFLYGFTQSLPLVFIVSGLIELYSTVYLLKLNDTKAHRKKTKEDLIDLDWIKYITLIYTIEGFAIALIMNRMIIYMHEFQKVSMQNVGLIFFIVYGISNIMASKLYKGFNKTSLKTMLIVSFVSQAILLTLFTIINQIYIVVAVWFFFELVSNITDIYSRDKINRSIFTNIGKKLSKFRITIALGNVLGQLVISKIWDGLGVSISFYFSSVVLIILSFIILFKNNKDFEKN
ncbi:MFS transporter [Senegalia massiliensis]|uniref:MFS transporter n=1 Tax=Senegalia massiliensis TaxID=1720316 RepID=A0A845QZ01_9CLOT|nr:MFS transporter [Senegalia massiliensis]